MIEDGLPRLPKIIETNETTMAAALKPFGWACTEEFWGRYYNDPWVFSLANAVESLTEENSRLKENT